MLFSFTFISLNSFSQNQYFYEFCVPGLTSEIDQNNITSILKEMGLSEYRVDYFSGKVVCFSPQQITVNDFAEKFNNNSFYIYFFNSGVQGVNEHNSKTIKEWNKYNSNNISSKVFVVIAKSVFSEIEKSTLSNIFKSNLSVNKIEFSSNNKKIILHTKKTIQADEVKSLYYSSNIENKLINLVEIYK